LFGAGKKLFFLLSSSLLSSSPVESALVFIVALLSSSPPQKKIWLKVCLNLKAGDERAKKTRGDGWKEGKISYKSYESTITLLPALTSSCSARSLPASLRWALFLVVKFGFEGRRSRREMLRFMHHALRMNHFFTLLSSRERLRNFERWLGSCGEVLGLVEMISSEW
jgi:hypothetical protein